jgi:hypothetical protein
LQITGVSIDFPTFYVEVSASVRSSGSYLEFGIVGLRQTTVLVLSNGFFPRRYHRLLRLSVAVPFACWDIEHAAAVKSNFNEMPTASQE